MFAINAVSGNGRWLAYIAGSGFVRDLRNNIDYPVGPVENSFTVKGMSDNGKVVALQSSPDVHTAGDTNGKPDGFVWNRATGALTLVTVSPSGAQGNAGSEMLTLSADGNRTLFKSSATNFVPGTPSFTTLAVYLRDPKQARRRSTCCPTGTLGGKVDAASPEAESGRSGEPTENGFRTRRA